jgi:hypothetical protein
MTAISLLLLFWPMISKMISMVRGNGKPALPVD